MSAAIKLELYERRKAPRYEAWIEAKIRQPFSSPISCVIKNVSETGAMIKLSSTAQLGNKFILCIPDDEIQILCSLVWEFDHYAGVKFMTNPS